MNAAAEPMVVVGVSGSPASARALRWAAAEADRLETRLKIVLIWSIEPRANYAPAISPDDYDRRQERAVSGLAATVRAVLGSMPQDSLSTEVARGMPERDLVEQSRGADLLVLGSASGPVTRRSIGPVIRACLSHAHCPVVVVGPEGPSGHVRDGADHRQRAADHQDRASATTQDQRDLLLAGAAPAHTASGHDGRPR
jgi:nucleotide-binding universal stress UspA family protein